MNYYTYGSAENSYNKQLASAYTAYMIFGSYFKKCRMLNHMEEIHLKMHYMTMKSALQYEKEEDLDAKSVDVIGSDAVENLDCVVQTARIKNLYYVLFRTGKRDYAAEVDKRGNVKLFRIPAVLRHPKVPKRIGSAKHP